MKLSFNHIGEGLKLSDLYELQGLTKIDNHFLVFLKKTNIDLYLYLVTARANSVEILPSPLLIELSVHLQQFLANLFNINGELSSYQQQQKEFKNLYNFKRNFIQRHIRTKYQSYSCTLPEFQDVTKKLAKFIPQVSYEANIKLIDQSFYSSVSNWQQNPEQFVTELNLAELYAYSRLKYGPKSELFSTPQKIDFQELIPDVRITKQLIQTKSPNHTIRRGLAYNKVDTSTLAQDQVNYCIVCHRNKKDSCRSGLISNNSFVVNPLGNRLTGCPLKQKISEMNALQQEGNLIAALSVITIDNPMVAATGDRICNDCTKSCIFQKQEPVNIPLIESQIFHDNLNLPFGFEIYSLLTRWQPLNPVRYLPAVFNSYRVLVAGQGPAGIAIAHYLLNAGCDVVAIDAFKIEPLPQTLLTTPIESFAQLEYYHSKLKPQGFGGVANYGITERWDKVNLLILRLLLERRQHYTLHGSVRLGSNLTTQQALKKFGFDHIAICGGSGKPNIPLDINNISAGNVRTASDFLMALQAEGLAKTQGLMNMQLRLPAIVIGGGLTAVDAATELLAFYPIYVEKYAKKILNNKKELSAYEQQIADEIVEHYKLFTQEKEKAKTENRRPDFPRIINNFIGNITICYRQSMLSSPAYRTHHQELDYALQQGVKFVEQAVPQSIITDQYGNCKALQVSTRGETIFHPAKTILIATGTNPLEITDIENNIIQAKKPYPDSDSMALNESITIYGDMHPNYYGSVVRALASAKDNYKTILKKLSSFPPKKLNINYDYLFINTIKKVVKHSASIYEIIVDSPLASLNFKPGQFYKLQSYNTPHTAVVEPLAITGAWSNNLSKVNNLVVGEDGLTFKKNNMHYNKNYLSFFIERVGSSTREIADLRENTLISLMGPLGSAYKYVKGQVILFIAEEVNVIKSLNYLYSLKADNYIILIASYSNFSNRIKAELIVKAADIIIWVTHSDSFKVAHHNEYSVQGNVLDALVHYRSMIFTKVINTIYILGSNQLISDVHDFTRKIKKDCPIEVNVNSLMQCMSQGICGECLQLTSDPFSSSAKIIFSCQESIHDLRSLDLANITTRLRQNSLLEKLN